MEIRAVRPDEHTEVADLTVAAHRHGGYDADGYEEDLRDVATRASRADVLVAVDDGAVVGGVTFVPDHASPYAEFDDEHACGIRMLAVRPDGPDDGVGEALVEECLQRARQLGRRHVILHSASTMTEAHHLCARLGFQRDPNLDWWPSPSVELLGFRRHLD